MVEIVGFVPGAHEEALRTLWTGYQEEAAPFELALGFPEEDLAAIVEEDLRHLDQFAPPAGRLLLALDDGSVVGVGCLRRSAPGVAEIKRMYLDPAARGRGIARRLIEALVDAARAAGYREVRLDTGGYMADAQRLYRAAGFVPCDPYPESEVPPEYHPHWLFMRLELEPRT